MWTKFEHIINTFDWSQFHFLRPRVFYLFIPVVIIGLLFLIGNRDRKKWKQLIQPALRPFMFSRSNPLSMLMPLLLYFIASTIALFSLARPAWQKKKQPGQKIEAVVLIALDCSKSMLATDIQPNRLERAKFKISDFLDANPRARVGLIAYAGTAHPVLPFTADYKLVKHHAASLANRIMPVPGSNINALLALADTMLHKVQAPSTILLLADALSAEDAAAITHFTRRSIHHIELLLLSTPNGAQVPGHATITSRQDPAVIHNLAQDTSLTVTPLTLDTSDVGTIATRISKKLVFEKDNSRYEKDWDDQGWLLIFPVLLITAYWFRKGWAIQWCWLPALFLLSNCGLKSKHPDWWYTKNYQAQLLENKHDYATAAETFEDDCHKAAAYYKAGNYDAAADLWALDSSSSATYNRGLALAHLGRYDEALQAFNTAAQLDPSLSNQAKHSIRQAHRAQHRADSLLQLQQTSVSKDAKDLASNKEQEKKDPLKTHKPEGKDEQLSSDTRVKKLPKFGDRATDEVATNIHHGKEAKWPPKEQQQQQHDPPPSGTILMRQVAADPAEFLHRRFELQQKRYYKHVPKNSNTW